MGCVGLDIISFFIQSIVKVIGFVADRRDAIRHDPSKKNTFSLSCSLYIEF